MLKIVFLLVSFLISFLSFSQESNDELKIYLDCNTCDNTFIKQNLSRVEFVRDQNFADVHLFFTSQTNGSGGSLYQIDFIGKNDFKDFNDKITFSTDTNMTDDDIRQKTLKFIKLGLVRYWLKKGETEHISVSVVAPESTDVEEKEKDPWNYWVFNLNANAYLNGQETNQSSYITLSVAAKRVTETNKFSARIGFNENKQTFSFNGKDIVSINNSKYANVNDVISINPHWSVGAFASVGSSIFSNKDFYFEFKPAIEYNFFKYSESAKKQLTLSYRNGVVYQEYIERSVFAMDKETLWEHEINLGGSINQEWGNIFGEASFEQYLHDTTLNSLSFYLGASVRLFKGFNFNINGNYSITRNQINLPAGDVSLEELLLQQQQLQSGYNYYVSLGFSYSFGSIYNTIVNPRFNF